MNRRENAWCGSLADLSRCAAVRRLRVDRGMVTEENPAQVEPIAGSDRSQVTLTEEGAGRVGIKTEPVGFPARGRRARSR